MEPDAVHDFIVELYANVETLGEFIVYDSSNRPDEDMLPPRVKRAVGRIHEEVLRRFLGAGAHEPGALKGKHILDIGCGNGADCFMLSQLVTETGSVTGIDFTVNELEFAKSFVDHHMKVFGYSKPNITFLAGNAEDMKSAGIKNNQFDIVFSDGVICMIPNKKKLMSEISRVLKPGGEFTNKDCFCKVLVTPEVSIDPVMWSDGFGGTYCWLDYIDDLREVGFSTPRWSTYAHMASKESGVRKRLKKDVSIEHFKQNQYGLIHFRAFKVDPKVEKASTVTYQGTMPGYENSFTLDHATTFLSNQPFHVDPEVTAIIKQSRLAKYFKVEPLHPGAKVQTKSPVVSPFKSGSRGGH